jgi:ParB-like chromosome segregation protein Spo0J
MVAAGAGQPFKPHQLGLQRGVDPATLKSGGQATLDRRALDRYRAQPDLLRARPVQADPGGFIYDGHHRCRVAAELGLALDVDVIDVPPGGRGVPVLEIPIR